MDHQGQIPSKQRHCDIGVTGRIGFNDCITVRLEEPFSLVLPIIVYAVTDPDTHRVVVLLVQPGTS